ncbi:TPA: hexapeptide transferase [Candidatus Falkowbacteria bacterium]|nr:hexapeptide transferase [Candidatus Falkowbacteria bacterium]
MLIYGAGGHARVVIDILKAQHQVIHGLIDNNPDFWRQDIGGVPVLGGDDILSKLVETMTNQIIIAVGDNKTREAKAAELSALGFQFSRAIHPTAKISRSASIGDGSVVAIGAIISAQAIIGDHAIINSGAIIDHDNRLGLAVHVSPGAVLGGTVVVGDRTWIGIGSTVINNLTIGSDSIVAAGSVVIVSVPDRVMVAGVPAIIKKNL